MEPSVASLSKYPKMFKTKSVSTYWANFQPSIATGTCTPEIINNRNKFIEDNKIIKLCDYSKAKLARNKKINNIILEPEGQERDHIEYYKTSDNKFVSICTSNDVEYMKRKGYSLTKNLYHTSSDSYIIIIDM